MSQLFHTTGTQLRQTNYKPEENIYIERASNKGEFQIM